MLYITYRGKDSGQDNQEQPIPEKGPMEGCTVLQQNMNGQPTGAKMAQINCRGLPNAASETISCLWVTLFCFIET